MPSRTLTDEARRYLALFEDVTDATAVDCVVTEEDGEERLLVLVAVGQMGQAIGPGGQNVRKVEEKTGKSVKVVEDAPIAEDFVANALAPAAVYNVTISEGGEDGETIAYVEVDQDDTGVAIGKGGKNIRAAQTLAKRHFDVDEIQLT